MLKENEGQTDRERDNLTMGKWHMYKDYNINKETKLLSQKDYIRVLRKQNC